MAPALRIWPNVMISVAIMVAAAAQGTSREGATRCDLTVSLANASVASTVIQAFLNASVTGSIRSATVCLPQNLATEPFALTGISVPSSFALKVVGGSSQSFAFCEVTCFNVNGALSLTLIDLNFTFGRVYQGVVGGSLGYFCATRVYFGSGYSGNHAVDITAMNIVVSDCIFSTHTAYGTGTFGAMRAAPGGCNNCANPNDYVKGSTVTITNSVFIGCDADGVAESGVGGALTLSQFDNVLIDSCNFTDNIAGQGAGAVAVYGNSLLILNTTFIENFMDDAGPLWLYGGALSFAGNSLSISTSYFGYNVDGCGGPAIAASCVCGNNNGSLSSMSCFHISDSVFEYNTIGSSVPNCYHQNTGPYPMFAGINGTVLYSGGDATMLPPIVTNVKFKDNSCYAVLCADFVYISSIFYSRYPPPRSN